MTAAEKFHDLGWRCGNLLETGEGIHAVRVHVHQVGPEHVYGTVVAVAYQYGTNAPVWIDPPAPSPWEAATAAQVRACVVVGHGMPPGHDRTLPPTP